MSKVSEKNITDYYKVRVYYVQLHLFYSHEQTIVFYFSNGLNHILAGSDLGLIFIT